MRNTKVQERYVRWWSKLCSVLGVLSALDLLYVLSIIILMFKRNKGTLYNVLIMGLPADILLFIGMVVIFSAVIVLGSVNLIVKYVLETFLDE
ncbi:MAG: hypothetical protein IKP66_05935 [Lachnospiraceae bacterium]|nr:hypothetical protein [Lachnospiraceae bacterium]